MPKKTSADAETDVTEESPVPTVRMERNAEQYPEPHHADVNVDEVDNWAAHGWVRCAD